MGRERDHHRIGRIVASTLATVVIFAVGEFALVVLPDPARAVARWGVVTGRVLLLAAATFVLTAPPIFALILPGSDPCGPMERARAVAGGRQGPPHQKGPRLGRRAGVG